MGPVAENGVSFTKAKVMKEIKKGDIPQEVFDLYDDYAHNRLSRRLFMDKLGTYTVGGLTASALMGFMQPDYEKKSK